MLEWKPILECDDEEDNPTCWACEYIESGKKHFAWITKYDEKDYFFDPVASCEAYRDKHFKTFTGAKKFAEECIKRWMD